MPEVWHWQPSGLSENLEFATDIRITRTNEVRDSYKDATQRFGFEYAATRNAEAMIDLYRTDPGQVFHVPEWPTATFKRDEVLALGATVIAVEDSSVYRVGEFAFICGAGDLWEDAEVSAVGAGSITLLSGLVREYAGTTIHPVAVAPLVKCLAPDGLSFASMYPVKTMSVEFLSISPIDLPVNPYAEFNGLPLVADGKVPFSPLTGAVSRAASLEESGFGAYALLEEETFARRYGELSFFDGNYADRMARRKFMHFMRGRDGEMWVPTGRRDLTLRGAFSDTALSLSVKPHAAAARMVGKVIHIKEGDNSVAREITAATDVSTDVQTLFIAPTGFDGTANACVSLAHRSRFDVDDFSISYIFTPSGFKATFAAPIVEVP